MARRLQGEEDEHAADLREKRRRAREARAAEERAREAEARAKESAEKLRGEERARAEAREQERQEKERAKAEKKKSSFWSSGETTSSTQKPAAKRAPFNFEAVRSLLNGHADISAYLRYVLTSVKCTACTSSGKAQDLTSCCHSINVRERPCECPSARQ